MGKVASAVFLMVLIECACWTQSYAGWYKPLDREALLANQKEKAAGIQFYFHDNFSGPNTTTVQIAAGANTDASPTKFGRIGMGDSPLTVTQDPTSEEIGRGQGMHCSVAMGDLESEMISMLVINIVFTSGKFNGSTLSILGRSTMTEVADTPIIGGSGAFRLARGYSSSDTVSVSATGNAIIQFNLTVFYYAKMETAPGVYVQ